MDPKKEREHAKPMRWQTEHVLSLLMWLVLLGGATVWILAFRGFFDEPDVAPTPSRSAPAP